VLKPVKFCSCGAKLYGFCFVINFFYSFLAKEIDM
jgi:hypothetical protein